MDCEPDCARRLDPATKKPRLAKDVYVLLLKSGAKYVGISENPAQRLISHEKDPNSWVRSQGGPECLEETITKKLDSAVDWEEKETWVQMLMRGPNSIRGAQYSGSGPLTAECRKHLARTLCQHAEACFSCGRLDCSVSKCILDKAPWLLRFVQGDGREEAPAAVVQGCMPADCSFSDALHIIIKHDADLEMEKADSVATAAEMGVTWGEEWRRRIPCSEWVHDGGLSLRFELHDTVLRLLPSSSWENVFARKLSTQRELWLLDCSAGNMRVDVVHSLSPSADSSFLLDFRSTWPRDGVQAMERITFLLHVDSERIWAVNPRDVRQEMVHVGAAMSVADVEKYVAASQWERFRPNCPRKQSKITVLQDPPGSGKTYNIVTMPLCPKLYPEYTRYDTFVYITKPHSAKEVVHTEFMEQLNNISHVRVLREEEKDNGYLKKLDVDGREVLVFFITGDSLFCKLGDRSKSELDMYEGICRTICEEGPRMGDRGGIALKGQAVHLCAKTLICMDEATKFTRPYAKALGCIVFACNSDAIVAGDCLQSIETKDNVLAYAIESTDPFPGSETTVKKGDKIRRCGSKLVDVIGKVVPWERYKLPLPRPAEEVSHEGEGEFIVEVLAHEENQETRIERVLERVKNSILELLLLPKDILCIFLFVSKNPFGDAIRDAIHSLWRDLLEDDAYRQKMLSSRRKSESSEYFAYYDAQIKAGHYVWLAHFHRSEEGRPIQTKDSIGSTRMVSVHAAQGDGRKLALVFGLSEMGIKLYTRGEENICYDSFVNVACSRAKLRTIVFQGKIYDDIWRRFQPYMDERTRLTVEPLLRIASAYPIEQVSFQNADKELVRSLHAMLAPRLEAADAVKDPQPLVDFEHHQVRAATFNLCILLRILADERSEVKKKKHVCAILHKVSRLPVHTTKNHREYHRFLAAEEPDRIPLLDYARSPNDPFAAICTEIRRCLEEQLERVRKSLSDLKKGKCPGSLFENALMQHPKDIVVLMYAIECTQRGRKLLLKMDAVYDIFKSFASTTDSSLSEHYCPITRATKVADQIVNKTKDREGAGEWQVFLPVTLGQQNGDALPHFTFSGKITFVYATDSEVIVVECRPQIGSALLADLSSTLLGYVALLQQPAVGKGANYKRLSGKRLSFLLVSMCTGWMEYVTGFEDLFRMYNDKICEAFCRHAELMCQGFHASVLDFHKCCHGRGEPSAERFRALKDAADKSKKAWAPQYVEDSLVCVQRTIERVEEEDGADPLSDFGCAKLEEELKLGLRGATKHLKRSLLQRLPPAET